LGTKGCDFSFSGLKTAMRQTIEKLPPGPIETKTMSDVCASLQTAIADILCDRVQHALPAAVAAGCKHFVLAGGVAANQFLRNQLTSTVATQGLTLEAPPIKLCTDNGVMIAWAGLEHLRIGDISPLNIAARPRWPLMELKERIAA
jgi:N6-L-threonylcarbamoyladenine synthase